MDRNYIIYGLGISGKAVLSFFAKNQIPVIVCDDNLDNLEVTKNSFLRQYPKSYLSFEKPRSINFNKSSIVIVAAGIKINYPQHKILTKAKKNGASLVCDVEIFNHLNQYNLKQVAITGTNGKSTTTALTGHIIKSLSPNTKIGGNIGTACFDLIEDLSNNFNTNFVLELSSYQLELINHSRFQVAGLLNITPDHIDHHGSMEKYIAAKKKIFQNQQEDDYAVINLDNEETQKIYQQLLNDKTSKSKLIPFSTKEIQENGVSVINGEIYNKIEGQDFKSKINPKFLIGDHNMENIACSFALSFCHFLKNHKKPINQEEIIKEVEEFRGLKHRLEFVGKINDISFYNDSKATNADSTSKALKSLDNIFWIVGGVAKEGGIESLKSYFGKITKAYLIGESSSSFAKIFNQYNVNYLDCHNLDEAMKKALDDAKNHSILRKNILLSPACASFDQWKNFEERGDYFCQKFNDLQDS